MYHAGYGIVVNKKDNAWDILSDLVCSFNSRNLRDFMHNLKLQCVKDSCGKSCAHNS